MERAYFLDRYVIVTGMAVRAVALKSLQVVELEGTAGTMCLVRKAAGLHASQAFGTATFRRPACACGRSCEVDPGNWTGS